MKKRLIALAVIAVIALCGFGFTFSPRPSTRDVDVTTRIEMIGGHQYVIAVSTTIYGYDAKSSIAMVHHAGCSTCHKENKPPVPRRRPPTALPYEGQF